MRILNIEGFDGDKYRAELFFSLNPYTCSFDIDPCQEPVETKHLFLDKNPLAPLEVENQGDVTYREPTTDSSLPKRAGKRKKTKSTVPQSMF